MQVTIVRSTGQDNAETSTNQTKGSGIRQEPKNEMIIFNKQWYQETNNVGGHDLRMQDIDTERSYLMKRPLTIRTSVKGQPSGQAKVALTSKGPTFPAARTSEGPTIPGALTSKGLTIPGALTSWELTLPLAGLTFPPTCLTSNASTSSRSNERGTNDKNICQAHETTGNQTTTLS